ncbi:MAG: ATP synthase F1 subunit epsilon [Candidatus Kapaibacterium sp.]
MLLQVDIVTPQHLAYQAEAQSVTLPGAVGPFQVLINHAPIISALEIGAIKIIDADGHEHHFATNGGFAEVKKNVVSIVVETAEEASLIDVARAERSMEKAQQRLEHLTNLAERAAEKQAIARAANRIKVAALE